MLRDRGRKGGKRRAVVDQAAAVLILQHALDTERATGAAPGEIVEETQMTDEHDRVRRDRTTPSRRRGRVDAPTRTTTTSYEPGGRRRGRKRRSVPAAWPCWWRSRSWSAAVYFVVTRGIDAVRDQFARAEDYAGPGPRQGHLRGAAGRHASPRWAAT